MNKWIGMGRVTRDIELKKTQNGTPVCTFTVAVNRDYGDGADFFNCTAWKKNAETAAKYLGKGKGVLIEGSMQSRKYKDKSGADRTVWEVQVDRLHFVGYGPKKDGQGDEAGEQTQFHEIDKDGDLPF